MPADETTQLRTRAVYDLSGGMVTNYSYSKVAINQLKLILNGDMSTDGSIVTRYGRSKVNTTVYGAGLARLSTLLALGQSTGADLLLTGLTYAASGELILEDGTVLRTVGIDPLVGAIINDYAFFVNGTDTPFMTNGLLANTYQIGIEPVTAAQYAAWSSVGESIVFPQLSTPGAHRWTYRYRSSITGARSNPHLGGGNITITVGQYFFNTGAGCFSDDPQVDLVDYFVQTAGADVDAPYYYLGTSPKTPFFYEFDVSDATLMVRETVDIDDNVAPANLKDIENFKGRMVGITGDYTLRYSKRRVDANGVVNLPTSWPATNEANIGWGDGDPLVKVVRANDFLFAFKKRSVWLMLGDFDSANFDFRQLKTNYTNVGLLNNRCVIQAGDSIFFISDDLKMYQFKMTDFSMSELRLQQPPPSDRIANLFLTMASAYRKYVNMVNYTFADYSQIWISFTDGATGTVANDNFSTFVYEYNAGGGTGAWHIHTGHEISSSVLAKDADNNYNIYTGDYQGFLWKHDVSLGDGAALNLTGSIGSGVLDRVINSDPALNPFTSGMTGCLIRCVSNTEETNVNQVRRGTYVDDSTMTVTPDWPAAGSGNFTVGGIDFQVQSRDDWLDDEAPLDYDKQGWYLDVDVSAEGLYGVGSPVINDLTINVYKNRTDNSVTYNKTFTFVGAAWLYSYWGVDIWPESSSYSVQVGLNMFFRQVSHKLVSQLAGQRLRVNGWTYHYQQLGKLRVR